MPELRRLSGAEVVRIFSRFGFVVRAQHGSHVKLRRMASTGAAETLIVPNHNELDIGTCRAILRQAVRYIPRSQLEPYFRAE